MLMAAPSRFAMASWQNGLRLSRSAPAEAGRGLDDLRVKRLI
jgi:hypothetical protein